MMIACISCYLYAGCLLFVLFCGRERGNAKCQHRKSNYKMKWNEIKLKKKQMHPTNIDFVSKFNVFNV